MNARTRAFNAPDRMLATVPTGKFEGAAIPALETTDLHFLVRSCFSRDQATRSAMLDELDRRRRQRGRR
jgi:hypothetical protein